MLHVPSMEGLAPSSESALRRKDGFISERKGAATLVSEAGLCPTETPAFAFLLVVSEWTIFAET